MNDSCSLFGFPPATHGHSSEAMYPSYCTARAYMIMSPFLITFCDGRPTTVLVRSPEQKMEKAMCSAPASRAAFSPMAAAWFSVRPTMSVSSTAL